MPRYLVSAVELITYKAEIEAEDENHARELAFEEGYLWDHGKVMWNEIEEDSIEISKITDFPQHHDAHPLKR